MVLTKCNKMLTEIYTVNNTRIEKARRKATERICG